MALRIWAEVKGPGLKWWREGLVPLGSGALVFLAGRVEAAIIWGVFGSGLAIVRAYWSSIVPYLRIFPPYAWGPTALVLMLLTIGGWQLRNGPGRVSAPPGEVKSAQATPVSLAPYGYRLAAQGGSGEATSLESIGIYLWNQSSTPIIVFVGLVTLDGALRAYAQQRADLRPGEETLLTFFAWSQGTCYKPFIFLAQNQAGLRELVNMAQSNLSKDWSSLTATGAISADPIEEIERVCLQV